VRAGGASNPRLLTDPSHPLVATGRCVAGLPGLPALEPARIDVLSSAEEEAEQRNLCVRRGVEMDGHVLLERSLAEGVSDAKVAKPVEVAIRRPQLANPVLETKRGNPRVMNRGPGRLRRNEQRTKRIPPSRLLR